MLTVGAIYGGVGAALLGAKQEGFNPLYLIEPRTELTDAPIATHFGDMPVSQFLEDFRKINVDVIVASPSCAQFSPLGMKRKDRGKLDQVDPHSFDMTKVVNEIITRNPKMFIMENVPKITQHINFRYAVGTGGYYYEVNDQKLIWLPYTVRAYVIDCESFWGYQHRLRIYFVGKLDSIYKDSAYIIPPPNPLPCRQILDSLPNENIRAINHVIPNVSEERKAGMAKLEYGKSYYGSQNNRRLDPERPAYTITSHCTRHIHYKYPRPLTVRECARIQGFPDSFIFARSETRGLDQVGKSIPVPVAQKLFERVKFELS